MSTGEIIDVKPQVNIANLVPPPTRTRTSVAELLAKTEKILDTTEEVKPLTKRTVNHLAKTAEIRQENPLIGSITPSDLVNPQTPRKVTRKQRLNKLKDFVVDAFIGDGEDEEAGRQMFLDYMEKLKEDHPNVAVKLLTTVMEEKEDLAIINQQAPIIVVQGDLNTQNNYNE